MSEPIDLVQIASSDERYAVEAYAFVGEGLRYASQRLGRDGSTGPDRHLDASELVSGVVALAAERWGLLGLQVLRGWGLRSSEDIGAITFQLIDHGVFGKQPSDRLEDFDGGPAFVSVLESAVRERLAQSMESTA